MIFQLQRRFFMGLLAVATFSFAQFASAVIRDGGVDPSNLGQGGWIYILQDATNHLAPSNVASVTNENSLFKYLKGQGLDYVIVKAATSNMLWTGSSNTNLPPMFTKQLVDAAHRNGLKIFGSNRSWGNDIPGEIAMADYVFQQGADGFIYDAEAEWESSRPWIGTNGPALAWQLCSTVRSNWPNKFIAHNPFDTVYLHFSFPFKEFGYWCDAVMPQVYHHAASQNNAIAAIHWSDWNYQRLHEYLTALPPTTNEDGSIIYWTNSIKPLVLMRDVYNGQSGTPSHPDSDVRNFLDYLVADPNAVTPGGYNGSDYFRSELHRAGQWANIKAATIGIRSNIVNNIIIDDARATMVGDWVPVKTIDANAGTVLFTGESPGDTNSFGTNYWRKTHGTGAEYIQFSPKIIQSGQYDVYEWHPTRPDASASVPFIINSLSGQTTIYVNQQTNGGDWTLLGRFNFSAGTNTILVSDNFPEPGRVAMVDGLKMVYVPVIPVTPGNLRATTISSSQIDLRWDDNSTNELDFIVERGTNSAGPYFEVGRVAAGVTNFSDGGLVGSTIYYYVVRARAFNIDSPFSNEASALTLPGPPTILTHPLSQTNVEGQSVTFFVEATSTTQMSYQWLFKNAEIPGATESFYTIPATVAADAGDYSVVVANQIGSTVSSNATLTIHFALNVSANPTNGGTIAISPLQFGYVDTNTVNIIATANPGFTFVGWSGDSVILTNTLDLPMTSTRTLVANFINSEEIIVDNPEASYNGVWTIGSAAPDKFGSYYQYATTIVAGGSTKATYVPNILTPGRYSVSLWYPQGTNRTSHAQVFIGIDGEIINTEIDQTTGGGSWQVVATGKELAAGTNVFVQVGNSTGENNKIVVADAVKFSFNGSPIIFSQPASQTVGISGSATFQVLAGSSSPLSYQWQFDGEDIPGATTSAYTRNNVQLTDGGGYSVVVSNQVDVMNSDVALLSVSVPVTFGSISASPESGFHFSLNGAANMIYTIETSSDLINWSVLTNIFSPDGNVNLTDPVPSDSARFYRAHTAAP